MGFMLLGTGVPLSPLNTNGPMTVACFGLGQYHQRAITPIRTTRDINAINIVKKCDLAGTVEAVGSGVKRFKVGDRVFGSNQGLLGRQGTFAEYAAVDEDFL